MKHTWKTSPVTVVFITIGTLLVILGTVGYIHVSEQGRYLRSAVTNQIEGHAGKIATVLSEGGDRNQFQIEDLVFEELQLRPSTSLITRSMVSVRQSTEGGWECVIDASELGVAARRIVGRNRNSKQ